MTELDTAFLSAKQDDNQKPAFYNLFLNTEFYIPTQSPYGEGDEQISPLYIESGGIAYLMLFDSEQRLKDWAQKDMHFAVLPGHLIVEMMTAEYHWALNVGTAFAKNFVPGEIAWLKQTVAKTKAEQSEKKKEQGVSILVRVPKDLPDGLLMAINQTLSSYRTVARAYLGQAHYAIKDEPPHLTLVVEASIGQVVDLERLRIDIADACGPFFAAGEHFDLMRHGESNVANEIVKAIKPFYRLPKH